MNLNTIRCSLYLTELSFLLVTVLPLSAGTVRIFVTNSAGDTVMVVDPLTNKVVQTIEGIEVPHGVNFSPDGNRVYVSNESENTLDVVDRESGRKIGKVSLSGHPNNIAVTKYGKRVFVCIAEAPGALDVVDTKSLQRVKSIPTKGPLHNVYVTPDGKYAVAGSIAGKFAIAVDTASAEPVWEMAFDNGVRPMAFDTNADGSTRHMYVQLSHLNGFVVVDFSTQREIARIELPDVPTGFGIAEGRSATPSHGIGVAPDGKSLWVNSSLANAVFVYSLPDLKLVGHAALPELKLPGHAPIGAVPEWIAFTPDSNRVYISNSAAKSVSVIDAHNLTEVARIPVGEVPKRLNTLIVP
jgi:YVTN family beta-propeller protein